MTDSEKVFGIVEKRKTTGLLLRNWLTFLLRNTISQTERAAYHSPTLPILPHIKENFNYELGLEIRIKAFRHKHQGEINSFEKIITHNNILCKKEQNGEYKVNDVFI